MGFDNETYVGSEGDYVINVTVSILNGTLAQDVEVVVVFYTMDAMATGK